VNMHDISEIGENKIRSSLLSLYVLAILTGHSSIDSQFQL
jgi:hypothetical protein